METDNMNFYIKLEETKNVITEQIVPVFIMPIYRLMVNFQQYISYMVALSFIGGGNQRTWSKPLTGCKSLTD
jgi:ABC-type dipeptide/oligopeptide/nickel transport system permease subunit